MRSICANQAAQITLLGGDKRVSEILDKSPRMDDLPADVQEAVKEYRRRHFGIC